MKAETPKGSEIPKDFYESLFDNALDGLAYCQMVFDRQGTPVDFIFIRVNKMFEKSKGLKDVGGKKVTDLVPGITVSNPELFEICGRVSLSGKSERFETYFKPLQEWFLVSVYSQKKAFFIAVFQNITDRKQIEKNLENAKIAARNVLEDLQVEKDKLAEAKAKDEALLESIGEGVIATDEEGIVVLINKMAEKLLGKKSEEIMGKSFFEVILVEDEKGVPIPLEERPMSMALSSRATTTTAVVNDAYYYVRKDKTTFPAAVIVSPVILGGKVTGTIEVFRDITKEKEVDRAKTEFVSLASHQLRTPLSSVRWYSDMLLDGDAGAVTEKQKQYLEEIQHGNLRMIELVNTLLHVSRLELGMAQVHIESVRLSKVVTEVLQDMESRIQKQNISVKVRIPSSLSPLMTDAKFVRIVVENLISNAIKYTGTRGKVEIVAQEVSAGELFNLHTAQGRSIGLSIIDNGVGIPLIQQDQIFKKLFRAENAREMDTDGTGLGLYLAKLVLQRMRGQIWFKSHLGEGTIFYVLLPYTGLTEERRVEKVSVPEFL